MKIKVIYRKNLKMTEGKLAAQVAHAVIGLGVDNHLMSIIVLGMSDKKYKDTLSYLDQFYYEVSDFGYTENPAGTKTCAAYYEEEKND